MKLFLDTNVWVRNFVAEKSPHHEQAKQFIDLLEEGIHIPYTSNIVLLECWYVLHAVYHQQTEVVGEIIDSISNTRNNTLIEQTYFDRAIELYKRSGNKISDCPILTQVPDGVVFCLFDANLITLAGEKGIFPKDVLNVH